MKRVLLLIATNLAIMVVLSIVVSVLGFDRWLTENGIDYFSLLVFQGQSARYLVSDPLGDGSNLFGTAKATIDLNVISSNTTWYVQVAALVTGHVCGLILAHDRAIALYRKSRDAVRSQYWMLVVMVGFTSLGLWLLSAVRT